MSETSLSSQSLSLVVRTKQEQPRDKTHKNAIKVALAKKTNALKIKIQ